MEQIEEIDKRRIKSTERAVPCDDTDDAETLEDVYGFVSGGAILLHKLMIFELIFYYINCQFYKKNEAFFSICRLF